MQSFLKALSDLNRIHSAQVAALLNGGELTEAPARKALNTPFWRIRLHSVVKDRMLGASVVCQKFLNTPLDIPSKIG
jgi:hypothetical protein